MEKTIPFETTQDLAAAFAKCSKDGKKLFKITYKSSDGDACASNVTEFVPAADAFEAYAALIHNCLNPFGDPAETVDPANVVITAKGFEVEGNFYESGDFYYHNLRIAECSLREVKLVPRAFTVGKIVGKTFDEIGRSLVKSLVKAGQRRFISCADGDALRLAQELRTACAK